MLPDDVYDAVAIALRRIDDVTRDSQREIAALKAQLAEVVNLLVARGGLAEGHRKHLAVVARGADDGRRKIRLRTYVDKYALPPGEFIDCEALIPLCKGRCCTLQIELTAQDVEERALRWDLQEPYVLLKDPDGRCTHQDRQTKLCGVYEVRPATCREYDCRHDQRIWLDWDQKIPAPI